MESSPSGGCENIDVIMVASSGELGEERGLEVSANCRVDKGPEGSDSETNEPRGLHSPEDHLAAKLANAL